MLTTPPYIPVATLATQTLTFAWDEWRVLGYYDRDLDVWWPRLKELTIGAQLGLTIATGEWTYHRFAAVNADTSPLLFLEAAWAGCVHPAYCKYFEADDDDWRGPVRNPLKMMMAIVNDGLFHMNEDPDVGVRAAWMFNLTQHVLPETSAFECWFSEVVDRLEQHFQRSNAARNLFAFGPPGLGLPVPRSAFDPARHYEPAHTTALIDRFLQGLYPAQNPFLNEPDVVAEADDFEGVPYRYA
jgi:hypothetical protein